MESRFPVIADNIISKCANNMTPPNYIILLDTLNAWQSNLIDNDLAILLIVGTIFKDDECLAEYVSHFLSITTSTLQK